MASLSQGVILILLPPAIVEQHIGAAHARSERSCAGNVGENLRIQFAHASRCLIVAHEKRSDEHKRFVEQIFTQQSSDHAAA